MKYFPNSILTILIFFCVLTIRSQTKLDTTSWIKIDCIRCNYRLIYPPNYLVQNECGSPYRQINGRNTWLYHLTIQNFQAGHYYSFSKKIDNITDYIKWRACAIYGADSPDESIYGDSIAKVTEFKNKNGIDIMELYVYVSCKTREDNVRRTYVSICGPVFAINLNLQSSLQESILFMKPCELDPTPNDILQLRLTVENFNYLYHY